MRLTINEIYDVFKKHKAICTDTRNIIPSSIFFALKGDNFNANQFVSDAFNKGCSYAVMDDEKYANNANCILVDNVLETLQKLAILHRSSFSIPFIGITGSNGKTTTKELINAVLSKKYKTIATKGNLNNHIGVPITVLSVDNDTEIAIIEMGANHQGEIEKLCSIANPDYGIITNIGKAHLEGFGGYEGVIKAKNELYVHIKAADGKVFVNSDNKLLTELSNKMNKIEYGLDEGNYSIARISDSGILLNVEVWNNNKWESIKTNIVGNYNFENIHAAICIGKYFGVEDFIIKQAIESYIPSNNRSQIIKTASNTIIMDAYNANPSSMEASLLNFISTTNKDRVLILGDMLELGDAAEEEHTKILSVVSSYDFDYVILVGRIFTESANNKYICFNDSSEVNVWLSKNPIQNKNILIKGSRGVKLENVIERL